MATKFCCLQILKVPGAIYTSAAIHKTQLDASSFQELTFDMYASCKVTQFSQNGLTERNPSDLE